MGSPFILLPLLLFFAFSLAVVFGGLLAWFVSRQQARKTEEIRNENERTYWQKRDELEQKLK